MHSYLLPFILSLGIIWTESKYMEDHVVYIGICRVGNVWEKKRNMVVLTSTFYIIYKQYLEQPSPEHA